MPPRILLVHFDPEPYRRLIAAAFPELDLVVSDEAGAEAALPHADAVIAMGRWLNRDNVSRSPRLKWIQGLLAGTDHLTPLLEARPDIVLTSGRGVHGPQMAETVVLHMFAFYRRVPQLVRAQAEGRWDRFIPRVLDGRTATILGMGAIAEHLAGVLKAFGMRVVGVTRTPRPVAGFDRVYPREELIAAVGEADFLVSLLPLSPETRRLVGADVFRAMRADAVFINVSRGGVVDEAALIAALREGRIAGAGLDVFEERVLPAGSPLWTMPNVFITPHIGGRSDRYAEGAMKVLLPNIGAFLRGDHAAMLNRVN